MEDDLSWLAGLIDAEGSLGLRRIKTRKSQVFCQVFVGMVDRRAVERAKVIAESLYVAPLAIHERKPVGISRRPFFSFNLVAKKETFAFLRAIVPYLRLKRVEAVLQYDFLSRASKGRHVSTAHDAWLCEMSERIKRGDGAAKSESLMRVRDDFPEAGNGVAWLAGYTDGDGSISVATGTKAPLLSYWARDKEEVEFVRSIACDITSTPMSPLVPARSKLSEHAQWRLDVRETTATALLLRALRPHLYSKQAQASLALLARSTEDLDVRGMAVSLIQDLNQGRLAHDDVQGFLALHPAPL